MSTTDAVLHAIIEYINYIMIIMCVHVGRVQIQPSYGSMLGGAGVMVRFLSQLFENFEEIICTFDGIEVNGTFVNSVMALCVSPQLSRTGQVPFVFRIPSLNFVFESIFTSRKFIIVSLLLMHDLGVTYKCKNGLELRP